LGIDNVFSGTRETEKEMTATDGTVDPEISTGDCRKQRRKRGFTRQTPTDQNKEAPFRRLFVNINDLKSIKFCKYGKTQRVQYKLK